LQFEFGGLLDQSGRNLGISRCLRELEKRLRLTHEIPSSDHWNVFPRLVSLTNRITPEKGIRSGLKYKSELRGMVFYWEHTVVVLLRTKGPAAKIEKGTIHHKVKWKGASTVRF
jgi:hypothetical protein